MVKKMNKRKLQVKVCGITNVEDYRVAVESSADFVGFIFYSKSPRAVSLARAVQLVNRAPAVDHLRVGVFVNEEIEVVRNTYNLADLDIVQLHGDESPEYIKHLNLPCWKVIRVKDEHSLDGIQDYPCQTILL